MNDTAPPTEPEIRRPNGQFMPGHGGRPRGAKNKAMGQLKAAIQNAFDEPSPKGGTVLDEICRKFASQAAAGDVQSFAVLIAYLVGKPRQAEPDKSSGAVDAAVVLLERLQESAGNDFRPNADMVTEAEDDDDVQA